MIAIAPLVVAAALQFWAPYTANDPVCPNGVQVQAATVPTDVVAQMGPDEVVAAWTALGARDCRIWTNNPLFSSMGRSYQCEIIAHELGHNWLGRDAAPDTDDHGHTATGIMAASTGTTAPPGVCAALDTPAPKVHIGTALRVSRTCRGHGHKRRCFYRTTYSSGETS